jgi:hypothetical protein
LGIEIPDLLLHRDHFADVIDERNEEMDPHAPGRVIGPKALDDRLIGLLDDPDVADEGSKE